MEDKSKAWDMLGSLYWNAGYNGGPGPAELAAYLEGLGPSREIAIIGASTRSLITAALRKQCAVTVIDFSARMIHDLRESLSGEGVPLGGLRTLLHDVKNPVPADLRARFAAVLSDRLLNRFNLVELALALRGLLSLLHDEGELRTTVRIGLYPRDQPLLDEGRRLGNVRDFFDEETWEIDYSKTGPLLEKVLEPHGTIPRSTLLEFYALRGLEKRFRPGEFDRLCAAAQDRGRRFAVRRTSPSSNGLDTFFVLAPHRDRREGAS